MTLVFLFAPGSGPTALRISFRNNVIMTSIIFVFILMLGFQVNQTTTQSGLQNNATHHHRR